MHMQTIYSTNVAWLSSEIKTKAEIPFRRAVATPEQNFTVLILSSQY